MICGCVLRVSRGLLAASATLAAGELGDQLADTRILSCGAEYSDTTEEYRSCLLFDFMCHRTVFVDGKSLKGPKTGAKVDAVVELLRPW